MKKKTLFDFPELFKEWNYEKNYNKSPGDFSHGSDEKVWWKCEYGHEWEAQIKNRTLNSSKCPYCSNKKTIYGFNDLETRYPEVAKQWSNKNKKILPCEILYGSHYKAWWKCEYGHEWQTAVANRTSNKKSNCPYCAGKKVLRGFNDLETKYPDIAKEWHPNKNGKKKPYHYTYGSNTKVWWLGKCGHEWDDLIVNRTVAKYRCPICSNKRIQIGFNDLNTTHPNISKEWNFSKNISKPTNYTYGSEEKVWWKCNKGHEWQEKIMHRTTGECGCPYCGNFKVLRGFNDLETKYPDIAKEWHPTKNGNKKPRDYLYGSNSKVWWLGKCGHEWNESINNRTSLSHKCPLCTNRIIVEGINDIKTTHPSLANKICDAENDLLQIDTSLLSATTNEEIWWMCDRCNSKYIFNVKKMVICNKRKIETCPKCKNNNIQKIHYY